MLIDGGLRNDMRLNECCVNVEAARIQIVQMEIVDKVEVKRNMKKSKQIHLPIAAGGIRWQ